VTSPPFIITLSQLLDSLELEQVNAEFFVGDQIDEIGHHISGGHIAAQALMAASRTVTDRLPHSMHMYFLRAGDARRPVDFEVTALHDGGTFSARRVTARQSGSVLLEGIASFSKTVDSIAYQQLPPDLPDPDSVPPFAEQHRDHADELGGWWIREQPIDYRYVDPSARLAVDIADRSGNRGLPERFRCGPYSARVGNDRPPHHATGTGIFGADGSGDVVSPSAEPVGLAAL
jgi:acyl-CoA thioesterase II